MRPSELLAARVAARITGGSPVERDVAGAPPMTHDFDIVSLVQRVIALEVTSEVDPEAKAMRSVLRESVFAAPSLSRDWAVVIRADTRVRGLVERITPDLAKLEAQGCDGFMTLTLSAGEGAPGPEIRLAEQGVLRATSAPAQSQAARVLVGYSPITSDVVAASASAVAPRWLRGTATPFPNPCGPRQREVAAVLTAIDDGAKANAKKLGKSGATDRELWIWCQTMLTSIALNFVPPSEAPALPAEITAVWVGLEARHAVRFWRFQRGDGWTFGEVATAELEVVGQ